MELFGFLGILPHGDATSALLTSGTAIVIIIALVEGAKRYSGLPARFAFPVDVVLGVAAGVAISYQSGGLDLIGGIVDGLVIGLSASGLYAGGRAVLNLGNPTPPPVTPVVPPVPPVPPAPPSSTPAA